MCVSVCVCVCASVYGVYECVCVCVCERVSARACTSSLLLLSSVASSVS